MSLNIRRAPEMREIKRRFLKKHFDANNGHRAISILLEMNKAFKAAIQGAEEDMQAVKAFDRINADQPRSVRMLNKFAEIDGSSKVYVDASTETGKGLDKVSQSYKSATGFRRLIERGFEVDLTAIKEKQAALQAKWQTPGDVQPVRIGNLEPAKAVRSDDIPGSRPLKDANAPKIVIH